MFHHKGLTAINTDRPEMEMLKCGNADIYIKPECVCSFYNVFEASFYHEYSSCPDDQPSDIVTQLKCPDCKKYSLNNNGPCINGGNLTCKGEEVAPEVTCQCPPNYEGDLCEKRIEKIIRICDRIPNNSSHGLSDCTYTSKECVTYSRNTWFAYRCQESNILQNRHGLPLCMDTENTTQGTNLDPIENKPDTPQASWTGMTYFLILLFSAFAVFVSIAYATKCFGKQNPQETPAHITLI
uniref:Uncharacterized protein LOC111113101 n=1 Tax=Crassostrea virginica TaxID=6565 RepID=A0A8B8BU15_CRAVI|nr:uncharacterized protein LOC111113101 [Crassostrea virginica]